MDEGTEWEQNRPGKDEGVDRSKRLQKAKETGSLWGSMVTKPTPVRSLLDDDRMEDRRPFRREGLTLTPRRDEPPRQNLIRRDGRPRVYNELDNPNGKSHVMTPDQVRLEIDHILKFDGPGVMACPVDALSQLVQRALSVDNELDRQYRNRNELLVKMQQMFEQEMAETRSALTVLEKLVEGSGFSGGPSDKQRQIVHELRKALIKQDIERNSPIPGANKENQQNTMSSTTTIATPSSMHMSTPSAPSVSVPYNLNMPPPTMSMPPPGFDANLPPPSYQQTAHASASAPTLPSASMLSLPPPGIPSLMSVSVQPTSGALSANMSVPPPTGPSLLGPVPAVSVQNNVQTVQASGPPTIDFSKPPPGMGRPPGEGAMAANNMPASVAASSFSTVQPTGVTSTASNASSLVSSTLSGSAPSLLDSSASQFSQPPPGFQTGTTSSDTSFNSLLPPPAKQPATSMSNSFTSVQSGSSEGFDFSMPPPNLAGPPPAMGADSTPKPTAGIWSATATSAPPPALNRSFGSNPPVSVSSSSLFSTGPSALNDGVSRTLARALGTVGSSQSPSRPTAPGYLSTPPRTGDLTSSPSKGSMEAVASRKRPLDAGW